MRRNYQWWQTDIIYQIYPRSYQDSNGDGVGDLPGIIERLDYVQSLNVGAVWLSPIYPSPMHDFGYDVADYCAIHPLFGTLADFDRLLAEVHRRGMKLILDLVPNHTSDEHPWFIESRSSRNNPKRDWYIWRDPAPDGGPPNNWLSYFGGPAWTFDQAYRPSIPPPVPHPAAGAELPQPGRRRRAARQHALLAGSRRGRLPGGCHLADDEGSALPG